MFNVIKLGKEIIKNLFAEFVYNDGLVSRKEK
jgi:hypothetical protein